jgi:hypothetical protein
MNLTETVVYKLTANPTSFNPWRRMIQTRLAETSPDLLQYMNDGTKPDFSQYSDGMKQQYNSQKLSTRILLFKHLDEACIFRVVPSDFIGGEELTWWVTQDLHELWKLINAKCNVYSESERALSLTVEHAMFAEFKLLPNERVETLLARIKGQVGIVNKLMSDGETVGSIVIHNCFLDATKPYFTAQIWTELESKRRVKFSSR